MADVELADNDIVVDAGVIGSALGIDARLVQPLIRDGKISTLSERGVGEDAGTYRLTFFYDSRRARLVVSDQGQILRRSSVDFGDRASPGMIRRSSP